MDPHVQDRVSRQYTAPKPRRAAMTERFLEEDLDEEPISDADEDGMRAQLARQRYVDQDEEVRFQSLGSGLGFPCIAPVGCGIWL